MATSAVRNRKAKVTAGILWIGLAVSGGCMHAKAKTPGPIAMLMAPEPPPRLLLPVAIDPPPAPPVTPADRSTAAPVTSSRPPASGRGTPPPATTPTQPATAGDPPPVLQTSGTLAELEVRAKERVDVADKSLSRVSKASLGRDARDQYESAARYIRLAREAMTAKNFPYAISCADKAATLANLLVK